MPDAMDKWIAEREKAPECGFLSDGEVVGDWVVKGLVGRGGSAEVYRVERSDGVSAALKLVLRTSDDQVAHRHFERECQVLSAGLGVRFPHWYGRGEVRGHEYLVEELLKTYDGLPKGRRALKRYLTAVCEGVAHLHAYGFVHRDLKPANVMYRLGADGKDEPVLVDFGLAAPFSANSPQAVSRTLVNGKLVVSGTPGYAAPELLTGGDITASADVHALGVILSKCFPEGVPLGWRGVVGRAMSSVPEYRYSSVAEFSSAFSRAFCFRLHIALGCMLVLCVLFALSLAIEAVRREGHPENVGRRILRPDATTKPEAYACWYIETLMKRARQEHQSQVSGKFKLRHPIPLPDLGPAHERFFELNDSIRSKYEPQIEALRKVIEADSRVGKCGRPIFYNYTIIDGL